MTTSTNSTRPILGAPQASRPLLGRDVELLDLIDLVLRDDVRMITITGPGGVGKTRLAMQVRDRVTAQFPDGADLIKLDAIRDPLLVLPAVAEALRIRESGPGSLQHDLLEALRHQRRLLVLDNFEQISADDGYPPFVTAAVAFLAAAPGLTILVTSRMPLGVYGEREYPLAPLPVPREVDPASIRQLVANPAVRLFVDRAAELSPRFTLTPENAAAIVEICRRLDGLPLAIELAAARTKILPPSALLARLSKQLQVLTGGPRDRPARQQTMRDAIAWSYQLLSEEERVLFRRLGVFSGGFTLDAAEYVGDRVQGTGAGVPNSSQPLTPDPPSLSPLDGIAGLVDESLVRRTGSDDEPRFAMYQTIEEFAREQLQSSGEGEAVRAAHAEWVRGFVEQASPELIGPNQVIWFERVETEHDNIRAALAWALSANQIELAQQIAGPLWRFWWLRGHLSEGQSWLERVIAADLAAEPTAARALILLGAGQLAEDLGDNERCDQRYVAALTTARAAGATQIAAQTLDAQANVAHDRGRYEEAVALHEEAMRLFTEVNDRRGIAASLHNLGTVAYYRGDLPTAKEMYSRSLILVREIEDVRSISMILGNLGSIARTMGDLETAVAMATQSLETLREQGDDVGLGITLINLADIYLELGDLDQANRCLTEGRQVCVKLGIKRGLAIAAYFQAKLAQAHGERQLAVQQAAEAVKLLTETEDIRRAASAVELLAELAEEAGDVATAARMLGAAAAMRSSFEPELTGQEERGAQIERVRQLAGSDLYDREVAAGAGMELSAVLEAANDLERRTTAAPAMNEAARQAGLTPREVEVLTRIAAGDGYQAIAAASGLSVPLVTAMIGSLYTKLGVDSNAGLAAFAFKNGLV